MIPIDTQYMPVATWSLLDSCGADSVVKLFPSYDLADTLYTRPDGKAVRLVDLSKHVLIYFSDSISWTQFESLYEGMDSLSEVDPISIGIDDLIPTDLDSSNQKYFLEPDSANQNAYAINAVRAWDFSTGDSSQIVCVVENGIDTSHFEFSGRIIGGSSVDFASPFIVGRVAHPSGVGF